MKRFVVCMAAVAAMTLTAPAMAVIIGVAGFGSVPNGTLPLKIAAPADALDAMVVNTGQQGFDEAQGVVLALPLEVDWTPGGPGAGNAPPNLLIPAGTKVDSHMIFLNKPIGQAGNLSHTATWTFDGPILGVMSDPLGTLEVASGFLDAAGTNYPAVGFVARGMEGADTYVVAGNTITVTMVVAQPGDWIRVVTTPAPGAALLGVIGLGMARRFRRRFGAA